jgi:hemerythrin
MEKFVWTNDYNLNISIIDEQHQHFFEIVNRVYDLLEKGTNDRDEIIAIINELKDYAFYHLATEEKYFNQFAYADMVNHMKAHTMFRLKAEEYSDRINNENEDLGKLALEIDDFAKTWLSHHIIIADKKYAPFFKEHGL